jgi:hypothetical protein
MMPTLTGSEVVFAGYGISDSTRDDYKGLNVRGRIVLVLGGLPPGMPQPTGRRAGNVLCQTGRRTKERRRRHADPSGRRPPTLTAVKGNTAISEYKRVNYPNSFYINEKVARAIVGSDFDALKSGTPQPKAYTPNVKMEFHKTTLHLQSSDVLGFLPGTDLKDQIVVLSAHYDHLGKKRMASSIMAPTTTARERSASSNWLRPSPKQRPRARAPAAAFCSWLIPARKKACGDRSTIPIILPIPWSIPRSISISI